MELRVKEICKQKGILQKDLAEKIGVSDIALRASLRGNPTISTLQKVAVALGVEVWELLTESTDKGDFVALVKCGTNYCHARSLQELAALVHQLQTSTGSTEEQTKQEQ